MTVYSYVIEHDLGFAPNPFHGACTLACCKPQIRKAARLGDYVVGTGAAGPKLTGHMTYWMRVDEILTFDDYWNDKRFRRKKPSMVGTMYQRYGDNIYHREGGYTYKQEDSFHSLEDGSVSLGDLQRDTGATDKVLVGRDFAFYGRAGIEIPANLAFIVKKGPGHRCRFTNEQVSAIVSWLQALPKRGFVAEPAHWQFAGRPKAIKTRGKKAA